MRSKTHRRRVLCRVAVVDAVDLGRLEHAVGADLRGAQGGGGVGGKEGIARAGGEDDDAAELEVPGGDAANEGLGHVLHLDGALHPGGHVHRFEHRLHGERVHHGRQHAHVIARRPFDAAFTALNPAENVAPPDHHDHAHPQFAHLLDLPRDVMHGSRVNSQAGFTSPISQARYFGCTRFMSKFRRFAAQFQSDEDSVSRNDTDTDSDPDSDRCRK
jgi:hypothetical protein